MRASYSCLALFLTATLSLNCDSAFANGEQRYCSDLFLAERDSNLQEIIRALGDGEEIPEATYSAYSTEEIGRAIVDRVRKREVRLQNNQLGRFRNVNMNSEADLILFFKRHDLESIYRNGFLNQHETGKSGGGFDPARRRLAEDKFTGLRLGQTREALKLRPKSAFLNIRQQTDLAEKRIFPDRMYGEIGAVMRNEIKSRALWISGDSVGFSEIASGLSPSDIEWLRNQGTFFRNKLPVESYDRTYYEAVIYGSLSISDVDYFIVRDQETASVLMRLGRPVYLFRETKINGRVVYEKGQRVFNRLL